MAGRKRRINEIDFFCLYGVREKLRQLGVFDGTDEVLYFGEDEEAKNGIFIEMKGDLEDKIWHYINRSALSAEQRQIAKLFLRRRGRINILELVRSVSGRDDLWKKNISRSARFSNMIGHIAKVILNIILYIYVRDAVSRILDEQDMYLFELMMLGYTLGEIGEKMSLKKESVSSRKREVFIKVLSGLLYGIKPRRRVIRSKTRKKQRGGRKSKR